MSLITDYEETEDPKETNATVDSQLDIDSGDDDSMENFSEEEIDEMCNNAALNSALDDDDPLSLNSDYDDRVNSNAEVESRKESDADGKESASNSDGEGAQPSKKKKSFAEIIAESKALREAILKAKGSGTNHVRGSLVVPNAIEHTEEEIPPIEDKGPTGSTSTPVTAPATGQTSSTVSTGPTGSTSTPVTAPTTRSSSSTVSTGSTGSTSMPVTAPATGSTASTVSTGQTVSEEVTGTGLDNPNMEAPDGNSDEPSDVNGGKTHASTRVEQKTLDEILRQAAKESGLDLEYSEVLWFIKTVAPSAIRSLSSTKGNPADYRDECDDFVKFLSSVKESNGQRAFSIIISEIVSYIHDNTDETFSAIDIITYCDEIYNQYAGVQLTVPNSIGYTKIKVMVDNAFIIDYLNSTGISGDLKIGNDVDPSLNSLVKLAVDVAYYQYVSELGDIADKYILAYQRIKNDRPEMLKVVEDGDYEAFYKMLKTFCGSSTVGIDLRDIDLNMESYSSSEAAALYAAVIAKMDELSKKYRKRYDNEAVERVVDNMASRGYRASQANAIEYYCEELFNPKKTVKPPKEDPTATEEKVAPQVDDGEPRDEDVPPPLEKDIISIDQGRPMATQAYIPYGYGLSKSHVEINKPYTEVFGIPFINIRHPIFKTIALKYSNKYSMKNAPKGKDGAIDKMFEKRVKSVETNADKAERQLIKEIKTGSLMSRFLLGDKTKNTQVKGEGLGLASSIEKGLRRITSFATNPLLVKNILKLIKMAMDGEETPVSRNTLVIATDRMNAYDRNPIVSNVVNDQFANVRVFNPVKPEKTAAVSKKYLKQFYEIVNPLENADEYIACGAFSGNLPDGFSGRGMFKAQLKTISSGVIDPSAVPDAAINAFRQDIMMHGGYPYTYVLTDRFSGMYTQAFRIARNNNFLGDLFRMDVDLVAIHVKNAGMDGIFILENHDAEVLFS